MSDDLLEHYHQELGYVRTMLSELATTQPKIASRLSIGPDGVEDPHVSRLIEGFSYLTARVRQKLDDEFPELVDSMLSTLYPHYQAPIPSMSIVRMGVGSDLTQGLEIPVHTTLETDPSHGVRCDFRTCYPTTVWPLDIQDAELLSSTSAFPALPPHQSDEIDRVLRIEIGCLEPSTPIRALDPESLRFYLRGQPNQAFGLYELLFGNCINIVVTPKGDPKRPITLGREALREVGFGQDEGLLPYGGQSFRGYRLLTEFFAFPQKFLFFDLLFRTATNLGRSPFHFDGAGFDLYLYMGKSSAELVKHVDADSLALGCTPIVNLFEQDADPLDLHHRQSEYHLVPDARRLDALEVYSVDRVEASPPPPSRNRKVFPPFFGVHHTLNEGVGTYYFQSRRPSESSLGESESKTELHLAFVDLDYSPADRDAYVVDVKTTCFNRDIPHRLPYGAGQPKLRSRGAGAALASLECLTKPSPTLRPPRGRHSMWRLVSHLNLNHLSLTADESGVESLREILRLYDFTDSHETQRMIDGLLAIRSRKEVMRTASTEGRVVEPGFCRGLAVELDFDRSKFPHNELFLFASVLERFLGLYCNINSFVKTSARVERQSGIFRDLHDWPARAGDMQIL